MQTIKTIVADKYFWLGFYVFPLKTAHKPNVAVYQLNGVKNGK